MKRSGRVLLAFLCLCAPAGASEGNLTQLTGVTSPLLDGADEVIVSEDVLVLSDVFIYSTVLTAVIAAITSMLTITSPPR